MSSYSAKSGYIMDMEGDVLEGKRIHRFNFKIDQDTSFIPLLLLYT